MSEKIYQKVEIVGTSTKSYDDAIQQVVQQARKRYQGLSWFEVAEMRGNLQGAAITYQITLRIGFLSAD